MCRHHQAYQANGLLYAGGLFVSPPQEYCLTFYPDGLGCTDLQLTCGSAVWQPIIGLDWSLLAGNKTPVCSRHEGGRGCMAEADTARGVLPVLVSLQHKHKSRLMAAACQTLT